MFATFYDHYWDQISRSIQYISVYTVSNKLAVADPGFPVGRGGTHWGGGGVWTSNAGAFQ